MYRIVVILSYLVCTAPLVHAAPAKFLLFPTGTSPADIAAHTGGNELAYFRTAPRCRTGVQPCRQKARHNLQVIWQGVPDGEGSCVALPTILILTTGKQGAAFTIEEDCAIRYIKRTLAMGHPFDPTPQAGGDGIDFGDAATGLDFIPRVPVGFKMSVRAWQRAGTLKCSSWDGCTRWTRAVAGLDYQEIFWPNTPAPTLYILQDLNHATVNPTHNWELLPEIPYMYSYTSTYPWDFWQETLAGFQKGAVNHWLDVKCAVAENLQRYGTCTYGGQLPTSSTFTCDPRQKMIAPQSHI